MTAPAPAPARPAGHDPLARPVAAQRRQVLGVGILLLTTTVASTLAALASPPADLAVHNLVRGWTWAESIPAVGALAVGVAVAALVLATVLVGRRCRVLPVAAVAAPVAGYLLALLLSLVVGRDRPFDSALVGGDSHPSPQVLVLGVAAGLLVTATTGARWPSAARRALAAALAVGVLLVAVQQVRSAQRWPLDVVVGALLAGVVVLVVRVGLEDPSRHRRCRGCAWSDPAAPVPPVVAQVTARRAVLLHRVALGWVVALVGVYGVLALTVGMPRTAESGVMGTGLEVPLQWSLLGLLVVGVLVARRWHLTGAVVVALAAGLLGYASSVEYPPLVGLLVTVVAFAPALALWLEWHRRADLRAAVAVAVVTSVLLGSVVGGSAVTYASYWGPTHPMSATPAPGTDVVEWMWAGATTATGTQVRLRLDDPAEDVRLVVSTAPDLSDPVATPEVEVDADLVGAVSVEGLRPATRYHYAVEVDGALDRSRVQSVQTFPEGPASFGFVVGSCQLGGSNGRVFDAMRDTEPLFALATGDWNYANIEANDVKRYQAQYALNLTAPAQAALYGQTSVAYVWDDHDYGGNDADRTSPSRPAAMSAYRQNVPHYPLAEDTDDAVYQAFTVGRVRFLLTDTRSARDPVGAATGEYRSTLGAAQREWLLRELGEADRYGLVVWVSPDPWVDPPDPAGDSWGGFAEERQEIADAVAADGVDNLLMLAGDAHMLAVDDGTNTDYAAGGGAGFPLFQAAAIDRPGSVKGGPYTGPVLPGGGQFGGVEVDDDGTTVTVTLTGWRWDGRRVLTHVLTFGG